MAKLTFDDIQNYTPPERPTEPDARNIDVRVQERITSNAEALERLKTPEFDKIARDWYAYKNSDMDLYAKDENGKYTTTSADLVEMFYEDRSWGNYNTISMSNDLSRVLQEEDQKRLDQFAYIQDTWNQLPSWWDDPNRNFGDWLVDSGAALIADPLNLVGGVIGKQTASTAFKETLRQQLKGKAAKAVSDKLIINAAEKATGKALGNAVIKSGVYEGTAAGGMSLIHDYSMQQINIKTGLQDEYSLKQTGIATLTGLGFGSAFGSGAGALSYKLTGNSLKNKAVQNLKELHDYGFDEMTGKALFRNLTDAELSFKGKSAEELKRIRKEEQLSSKSLAAAARERSETKVVLGDKTETALNFSTKGFRRAPETLVEYLNKRTEEIQDYKLNYSELSNDELQRIARERWTDDPDGLIRLIKKTVKTPEEEKLAAQVFALDELTLKQVDDLLVNAKELESLVDPKSIDELIKVLDDQVLAIDGALQLRKALAVDIGRALQSFQAPRKTAKGQAKFEIGELIIDKDNLINLNKEGSKVDWYRSIGRLDDVEDIAEVLGRSRKADKWDIINEYINNNLLSSPDTHMLNITSSLWNMHWKPLMKLIRAGYLAPSDAARAKTTVQEAFNTYMYTYVYLADALKASYKSFRKGRPLLDGMAQKLDASTRQGVFQGWLNGFGDAWLNGIPVIGKGINKYAWRPASWAMSAPLRVLSAGDEFLKTASFKASAAAQVHTVIAREFPQLSNNKFKYKDKFKELMDNYIDSDGQAITASETRHADKLTQAEKGLANDPLHYAREITYTNPATSINPVTKKAEGGITGQILKWTADHKWSRALGLHFINTPSNLIRWVLHHSPFGKLHFQLKHMTAVDPKTGKYIDPEAAAEANARVTAGYALVMSGLYAAHEGKITGGMSPDYFKRSQEEATTGKQPYSYKTDDGRYVALDRGDPIMTPFFLMADLYEVMNEAYRYNLNEDIPEGYEKEWTEISVGITSALTRNLTSKFYTRDILETANLFLGQDHLQWRNPERKGAQAIARYANKIIPLSGAQRYKARVSDEYERDMVTLQDRIAGLADRSKIMPRRNIFGEPIDRKNGWFFGLGNKDGIMSSPFSMTKTKNKAVMDFFETEGREFKYAAKPSKDQYSKLDLKVLKNNKGQTAYDRWMELKGTLKISYPNLGKGEYTLKEIFEHEISNPNSTMNATLSSRPDILGVEDPKQNYLLEVVRGFEKMAYAEMIKEYPIIMETYQVREKFKAYEILGNTEMSNKIRQEGRDILNRLEAMGY
jgi:hypothetical protein